MPPAEHAAFLEASMTAFVAALRIDSGCLIDITAEASSMLASENAA